MFFSPTSVTEKAIKYIGRNFSHSENIDISKTDLSNYVMNTDDFCIVGVPSFGGRLPEIAAMRLQQIKGKHTPVFLLVTYGGSPQAARAQNLVYPQCTPRGNFIFSTMQ